MLRSPLTLAACLLLSLVFAASAETPLPPGVKRVPVTLAGGFETNPVDHGRPVILIASALGVAPEVFRETFTHVHPAGPGSGGPTREEAQKNKKALMDGLGKFGVTNDRLDTVSNYYRYPPGPGGRWKTKDASANALVKDGKIVGFEVVDHGSGYTSEPTVTVPGVDAPASFKVKLAYTKEFDTNGSIQSIAVEKK
ncbi:MAG TPA: hypothetical protein VGO11_07655 [Chthoniobacteraceae bacterium]|jgi:hypothetical protein|nr:hypothetical protein [Chthoniobacteraceae bacterium]